MGTCFVQTFLFHEEEFGAVYELDLFDLFFERLGLDLHLLKPLAGCADKLERLGNDCFARRLAQSQNAVFLSALSLTLNKYTYSDKTLITTIFNGRSNPFYYNTQGFLVKTLPLIFNNENRQDSIKDFINGINEAWKDTIKYSEYPYTNIAEKYQLKPEFFFTYQEFLEEDSIEINDKSYQDYELADQNILATSYKINFDLYAYEDKFVFKLDYNDQLYSEEYIKTFLDSMQLV